MTDTIKYTTAIREGKLRLSAMQEGESVSGTIEGVETGANGPELLLNVLGQGTVRVYIIGNLKRFFDEDAKKGRYKTGKKVLITRRKDFTFGNSGITSSTFTLVDLDKPTQTAPAAKTANTNTATAAPFKSKRSQIDDELKAMRKAENE